MPFGASLKFAAAQNFLEKPSLRTTFTKYVRARFERTNAFSMVGGRSARFTYRAIFWRSRIAKLRSLFAGLDYEQHGEAGAEVLRHHLFACQIEVGDRRGRKEGDRGHQQQRLARNHQHTDDG